MEKVCLECGATETPLWYKFGKQCKSCYKKNWYLKNRDKELNKYKARYSANKELAKKERNKWKLENPDYYKTYVRKNRKKLAQKAKERYHSDPNHKLRSCLRARLLIALREQNTTKKSSLNSLLGCSIHQLKKHLESQFDEGMSWDNHGRDGWHIDHIRPLAKFDLSDSNQLKLAWHYTNLQPLWAKDNLKKSKY